MGGFILSTIQFILSDVKLSITLLVVFIAICIIRYRTSPWRRLPPGPPGLPLLGNILSFREKRLWLNIKNWSKIYGPIMHINVAGQPLIVLNTHKVTTDLLERRAEIYSDRPLNIVVCEMMTGGYLFPLAGANDVWRRMRKAAREAINRGVINKDHHPVLLKEAVILASSLMADCSHWMSHIHRAPAAAMVAMTYDKEPLRSTKDPMITWLHDFARRIARAGIPGAHLAEFFTWMRHIPPGLAAWKRKALKSYKDDEELLGGLFNDTRKRTVEGSDRPSLTATLIRDKEKNGLSDIENIWLAGSLFFGGDAPSEILEWWLAAMIVYPETQKKAQEELDKVVGWERVPSFDDYEELPYIRAMVKESLRWAPSFHIGAPHHSTQDDWYNGYFIPKHSIMIPNVLLMNRDPEVYGPDAHHFDPAHYLDDNGQPVRLPPDTKEDGHVTFGFGRRACVGRQVAIDGLFINIAVMLWAMNIDCAVDGEGNPSPPDVSKWIEGGLALRPTRFQCKVTPRIPNAMSMLESVKNNLL